MSYDGFVTGAVAFELKNVLIGGRIDKIYQPEADELVFHIHAGGKNYRLYLSVNGGHARLHFLSDKDVSNPQTPFSFCMLLRKHFQGGRISDIRQIESERIIWIDVSHPDEMGYTLDKRLIIEIMGKHSNAVVIDTASGKILDSIKRIGLDVNRFRQILPGLTYLPPPSQGKTSFYTLTAESLVSLLATSPGSPAKALIAGIQGVGPLIATEIVERASRHYGVTVEDLTADQLFPILNAVVVALKQGDLYPSVYLDSDKLPLAFHVFQLISFQGAASNIGFPTASEAIEHFFSQRASTNRIRQKASDLTRAMETALEKLFLKKQRLAEDLLKASGGDTFRLYGELLTAYLHELPGDAKTAIVKNYYNNDELIEIPMDSRYSASVNAQKYYRKYAKSKTAVIEKTQQLVETDLSIDYLESVLSFLTLAETVDEIDSIRAELVEGGYLRRRKEPSRQASVRLKPQSFLSSDGFRIMVGRNNKENDQITFKSADKRDLWFHVKDLPGAHVVLATEGKEPTEPSILEAAALAAYYSKARFSANVPVDYTKVRFVKKPSGARPGMVIFTDNRTLYVDPKDALKE